MLKIRLIKVLSVIYISLSFFFLSNAASPVLAHGTTIVLISDLNGQYGSTVYGRHVDRVLTYIEKLHPDLVICAGDMIAGQKKSLSETQIRSMWQAFASRILNRMQLLQIPFVFTLGNHDGSSSPTFVHERRIAEEFWLNRHASLVYHDFTRFPACYSFVFREIFFAIVDASSQNISAIDKFWLEMQLAGESARSARLRVVIGHLPLYAISQGRNQHGDVISDADSFHELLEHGEVDYYISGHHHAYYLSRKGQVKFLACGALGGGARKLIGSDKPAVKTVTTLYIADNSNDFRIFTHDVTNNLKSVSSFELPSKLSGFNGVSQRYNAEFSPIKQRRFYKTPLGYRKR